MTEFDEVEEALGAALDELDSDETEALTELLEESPGLLRQTLEEYGYLGPDGENADAFVTNEEPVGLTDAQRELGAHLEGHLDTPQSVEDIVEVVGSKDAAFRQQYNSAQYRSWMSEQLNALVKSGRIGRFRDGRTVYYTKRPALAVKHWVRLNERFVDDLTVDDTAQIADDTKMPARPVREAIRSINDD